tara:strand:- start:744 stop:1142 length:399 start_codon:yes stop_codon:yes gene_type:complete
MSKKSEPRMKFLNIFISLILVVNPISLSAEEDDKYLKLRKLFIQSYQEKSTEVFGNYLQDSLPYLEHINKKDKCSVVGKDIVSLILVIDETGMIIDVAHREDNKKSQCFSVTFLGQYFPKPPFAPYYVDIEL